MNILKREEGLKSPKWTGPLSCWQLINSRLGHLYRKAGLSLYWSIKLHGMFVNFIKSFKSNNTRSSFPLFTYINTNKTFQMLIFFQTPTFQVACRQCGRWKKNARHPTALFSTWFPLSELCDFFDFLSSLWSHSPKLIYSVCSTVILLLYTTLKTLELSHFHLCKRCRGSRCL